MKGNLLDKFKNPEMNKSSSILIMGRIKIEWTL